MPAGRPSKYCPALIQEICEAIAHSSKGLHRLCKANKGWPHPAQIVRWLDKYPEFRIQYARAREEQAEFLAEEIIAIADETDASNWASARLRVDARKWAASKLAPKRYGEKITQEVTGVDGSPLIPTLEVVIAPKAGAARKTE